MRQIKVKDDSCEPRELYKSDLPMCYSPSFSHNHEDRRPFGPNNKYENSKRILPFKNKKNRKKYLKNREFFLEFFENFPNFLSDGLM